MDTSAMMDQTGSERTVVTDEDFVLDVSEDIQTDKNFASQGFWKGVLTRFRNNTRAMIGLIIIVLIMLFSIFGPMLSGYGYREIVSVRIDGTDVVAKSLSPRIAGLHKTTGDPAEDAFADKTFLFGTDTLGRDLWTRVWYGARISVMIAFVTIFTDMVIGMSYGLISGYFGQTCDAIMQRFVEISNSIPRLVIVGVLATFMPKGVWLVIVALLLTEWIGMSKIARAEMLKIKGLEYIMASRTLGAKNLRIIFSDVLPNTIGPVITQVMFSIPVAIFTEAFLSFVGVGIVLPQCSIGSLIEDGFNNITTLPYQILPPIIVLALLMLAFNFVGDGLREALAPRIEDM
ncbi:MAG: ABC transporter permease [Lachnospiraceae bacterium]|nr:ABC transporter permease [Lachnospiraceae bacterium]